MKGSVKFLMSSLKKSLTSLMLSQPSRTVLWVNKSGGNCAGGLKRKAFKNNVNFGLFFQFSHKSDSKSRSKKVTGLGYLAFS